MKRRIEEERWDMMKVNAVRGTPAEPAPGRGKGRVLVRVRLGEETSRDDGAEVDDDEERAPNKAKITKKWYDKFGWTEGCEGCNIMRSGMSQRPHAGRCRKRMEEELWGDGGGRKLMEEARFKEHTWFEERHM